MPEDVTKKPKVYGPVEAEVHFAREDVRRVQGRITKIGTLLQDSSQSEGAAQALQILLASLRKTTTMIENLIDQTGGLRRGDED